MSARARVLLVVLVGAVVGLLVPGASAPVASATEPAWAPASEATVHPGVQTFTDGGQCTANFVFYDGTHVYLGQAAHCAGTDGATVTDGCDAGSLPLGTEVEIEGASRPGELAYSSWIEMQASSEDDDATCQYNDFALVRVHSDDVGSVNPSVPFWGGPTSVGASTGFGDSVYSYGNSILRLGLEPLSPKTGVSLGQGSDGWNHPVYTVTPGVPGDSGSAVLGPGGQALGVLVTLQVAPLAGSNGVTDIDRALEYLRTHDVSGHGVGAVELASGTTDFSGSPLPVP